MTDGVEVESAEINRSLPSAENQEKLSNQGMRARAIARNNMV